MSLWFTSGTLRFTLFETEILCLPPGSEQRRNQTAATLAIANHGRGGHHGGAATTREAKATPNSCAATLACPAVPSGGSRPSHGGGTVVLGQGASEEDGDNAGGVEEDGESALVLHYIGSRAQRHCRGVWTRVCNVGRALVHGGHLAISSNTWLAAK